MPPTPIPEMLRETMAEFGMSAVNNWWEGLTEPERDDVIELWQSVGFGQPCGVRVGVNFVDASGVDEERHLWHSDFYEYLVNHEVYLIDLERHIGGVCTREAAARAAVRAGVIP